MKLHYIPYKIFKINNLQYIYLSNTGAIYLMDDLSSRILKLGELDETKLIDKFNLIYPMHYSNSEIKNAIEIFKSISLLVDKRNIQENSSNLELTGIELMVSQRCNLRCSYCYADGGSYHNMGDMDEKIGRQAIDFLFTHSSAKSVMISFFGGEPLLRFDLIRKFVEYAKKLGIN